MDCTRKAFIGAASACAVSAGVADVASSAVGRGIRVRFLGTGAAGWRPGAPRRQSSALLEGRVLIDLTRCCLDMIPKGCRPEAIFYTHSHGDHYDPASAVEAGVKRVYCHETWFGTAKRMFAEAAAKAGVPSPAVTPLRFGQSVEEFGLRFTSLPANHCTTRMTDGTPERTSFYLVEKGESRLLYATDTGGIPGEAARIVGIDPHVPVGKSVAPGVNPGRPITALVMEATMGPGAAMDEDFRIFVHSSVETVRRTAKMLLRTGRYCPPAGQPVYLTHMGVGFADTAEKIDATLPAPLRAAADGMEVVLG